MNKGVIAIIIGIADIAPINTKITASFPFPWISISCPGRTERNDSSSVAPVRIEGIKSRIVWVIAKETINETRESVERNEKEVIFAIRRAVIVLMCIPGVMPVIIPKIIPANIARIISNTYFEEFVIFIFWV